MSLRDEARRSHPDFPFLDAHDRDGVARHLQSLGWLQPGEVVEGCEPAGSGNMNLTLRVQTSQRVFVLKQARPWVEKYDEIPAPWDRARSEIAFYRAVESIPALRSRMPRILESDTASRTLLLEFLEGAGDFADLYAANGATLAASDLDAAADFAATLHAETCGGDPTGFENREMRALNHAHIYEIPLAGDHGLDLDELEAGLAAAAKALMRDRGYRDAIAETGERYLGDGPCLLHGDYFPGSWLRSHAGFRVIDPEFAFYGEPEFDVGCAIAHFALAGCSAEVAARFLDRYRSRTQGVALRNELLGRVAGAEVMRRLIGVAQLPLSRHEGSAFRTALLQRSREAVLSGDPALLFDA